MVLRKLKEDSVVTFRTFFVTVTFLVTLIVTTTGYFFYKSDKVEVKVEAAQAEVDKKVLDINKHFDQHVEELNENTSGINIRLAEIQTDIVWIRRALRDDIQTGKPIRRSTDR